jgi:2-polyprenyl-3-methyl-5-hydroxy-6-metoxy-1,4-benzoquinol methylase
MTTYKDYGYNTENWNHIHAYVLKPLLKLLSAKKDRKILDLGCGNGWLINHLIELGYDAYGTDASQSGIDIAKRKNPGRFFIQDLSKD